ncbi:CBS domain-containing protein [bacterium]|nr:CBS domain-containing protein [bacterium]
MFNGYIPARDLLAFLEWEIGTEKGILHDPGRIEIGEPIVEIINAGDINRIPGIITISVTNDKSVNEIYNIMLENQTSILPVVSEDQFVGIITKDSIIDNIIKHLLSSGT